MKKLLLFSGLMLMSLSFAMAQGKGSSALGLSLAYNTQVEITGLGIKYQYGLTDQVEISPAFTYFFENDDISAFSFDVDARYLFPLENDLTLYPILGINFTNMDFGPSSDTGFGINAGVGIRCPIADNLLLGGEFKRSVLLELADQPVISFSLLYKF